MPWQHFISRCINSHNAVLCLQVKLAVVVLLPSIMQAVNPMYPLGKVSGIGLLRNSEGKLYYLKHNMNRLKFIRMAL